MQLILITATVGLLVGLMVGLTGMGGGALLVPILVLGLRISPIVAVGTGAAFITFTKVGAAWSYYRKELVDVPLVLRMCIGSVPGAVLGVGGLALFRSHAGEEVNSF